jgi:PleD family two-component response regulator
VAERAKTRGTTRSGVRRGPKSRSDLTAPIDDEQLLEEADLSPLPAARVAICETSTASLTLARAAVAAQGYEVVIAAAGGAAVADVTRRMMTDPTPDIVLVGLPGGEALLDAARALAPRRPVLIAAVPGSGRVAAERAHAAGADLVALRPHDPERLGPVLFAAAKLASERVELITARGAEARLRDRVDKVGNPDTVTGFQQFEYFQRVLELEIKRARRYGYPLSVCVLRQLDPDRVPSTVKRDLRARTAAAIATAIRDIDMPVELPPDRFLVLLPYTDADGAAVVAQRIVGAVAKHPPVRGNNQDWRASVTAGVSGVASGGELSFAKLMRDASAALLAAEDAGEAVMIV